VATADSGYRFVNWTTTAGTFGNATAATTIFTMPSQSATVTAHFAINGTMNFIANVPDTNQPPTQTLNTTINITNYCAPIAMVNILCYWDVVKGNANATGVTAGLAANTTAEYLGYFMDTNNNGSPDRQNNPPHTGGHLGTYASNISPGTVDFVRWDAGHARPVIPDPAWAPLLPGGKSSYTWNVTNDYSVGGVGFPLIKLEIDAVRPLVVTFSWWRLTFGKNVTDPQSGKTISVFNWGAACVNSTYNSSNPLEIWNWEYDGSSIGHAVTCVGYILNWNPIGLGVDNWIIVHDTWGTTPENIAVPWSTAPWASSHPVHLSPP
jgi:hypothetical protein